MTDTKRQVTCKDTTWLVSESRERDLSEQEKSDLHTHVAECGFCKHASKQFEVLFRQLERYFDKDKK